MLLSRILTTHNILTHNTNLISNVICSIISDYNIKSIKVVHLRSCDLNTTHPIKVTFATSTDAFDILKSKKK